MKDAHENLPYHAKLLIFLKLIHLCDVLPSSGELDISSNQHLTFKNVKFDFLDESDVLVLEPVCATINNSLQIGDGSKMKMNDSNNETNIFHVRIVWCQMHTTNNMKNVCKKS